MDLISSTHKLGHVATYPGGGYPQILGTSYFETLTVVQDLKAKGWIDLLTRAVIFEFTLYSPGTDMTAMVAMLAEFPLTGGVITSYEIQSQRLNWFMSNQVDPLMVLQVCNTKYLRELEMQVLFCVLRTKKLVAFRDSQKIIEVITKKCSRNYTRKIEHTIRSLYLQG